VQAFAYKIVHENNEDGIEQIDVTLVSQTKVGYVPSFIFFTYNVFEINIIIKYNYNSGWLPKFLINRVVGRVLADYVTTVVDHAQKMEKEGSLARYRKLVDPKDKVSP